MRCECARPRALSSSLSALDSLTTETVVEQMCENDLQNTVLTDFRVQMTVFQVVPFASFRYLLAS